MLVSLASVLFFSIIVYAVQKRRAQLQAQAIEVQRQEKLRRMQRQQRPY